LRTLQDFVRPFRRPEDYERHIGNSESQIKEKGQTMLIWPPIDAIWTIRESIA